MLINKVIQDYAKAGTIQWQKSRGSPRFQRGSKDGQEINGNQTNKPVILRLFMSPKISREFQGINRNGSPVVPASKGTRRNGRCLFSRLQLRARTNFRGRDGRKRNQREINKAAIEREKKNSDRSIDRSVRRCFGVREPTLPESPARQEQGENRQAARQSRSCRSRQIDRSPGTKETRRRPIN